MTFAVGEFVQGLTRSSAPSSPSRMQAILKASWVRRSSASLEMDILKKCEGLFGCPRLYYSLNPVDNGIPTSNHIFLPTAEEADNAERLSGFHWTSWKKASKKTPSPTPMPQWSSMHVHVHSLAGSSLTLFDDPMSLMAGILHAVLGWLNMLQVGALHRDVKIGNVLALIPPVEMENLFSVNHALLGTKCDEAVEMEAARLENLLVKLGVGRNVSAFISDADSAVEWSDFPGPRSASRSASENFMSAANLISLKRNQPHLHTPMDDLYSFFYVAQWAAVFRPSTDHLPLVKGLRDSVSGLGRSDGTNELKQLTHLNPDLRYGLFLNFLGPVFKDWLNELDTLAVNFGVATRGETDVAKLRLAFFATAYRGVGDLMEVIHKHQDSLRSYQPVVVDLGDTPI
ncbi:hypothetical protein FB45DRAFT_1055335 [Roridomyces roridus]|uniref:Fungal-type protein kinase domain-containing protein n=1 Tax=Roridomyces roridus TaxID=1738132 RepID=A0AAD7FU60_9AGAR|nr:hypothetical protein FB45DRAFT_1055335 [Roridomyces roridus]